MPIFIHNDAEFKLEENADAGFEIKVYHEWEFDDVASMLKRLYRVAQTELKDTRPDLLDDVERTLIKINKAEKFAFVCSDGKTIQIRREARTQC